jgi:hypothetical protein
VARLKREWNVMGKKSYHGAHMIGRNTVTARPLG